jgi:CHASE2 domain-containing sensor protein
MAFRERIGNHCRYLISHGFWYWLRVALLIVAGIYAGHWINEREIWTEIRFTLYQTLISWSPREPHPDNTTILLIDDDDYWLGKPAGRAPIKRDFLADLVNALDEANPAVIAIDFDLRSPDPGGNPVEQPELQGETQKLLEAVRNVASRRRIVLPKTIVWDDAQEMFVAESDIYKDFPFNSDNVRYGYIIFNDDRRRVPLLTAEMANGAPVKSFSQAIVQAYRPNLLERYPEGDELPYGGFIRQEKFKDSIVTARDVLARRPEAFQKIAHKVVLIGSGWSSRGYKRGEMVDTFHTPVGALPGVFVHANYAEALLDGRIYRPFHGWLLLALEIFWSLAVALPFALDLKPWKKFVSVAIICLIIVIVSYLSLMSLNLFYDFFAPILLVIAHGTFEQVREWRACARKCLREHTAREKAAATAANTAEHAPAQG